MPKSHRFWDRIADRYDRTSERHAAYRNMRLAHMRGFLGADDTVLDFACATGRLAFDLAPHVAHVLGIDLSEGMIARAKAKLSTRCSCQSVLGDRLPGETLETPAVNRSCARLEVKPVGEPDAGNPHVRFDEWGGETEQWLRY